MRLISCTAGALLSLALLLSGCSDEQVTTYRVPKEERPDLTATVPAATPASTSPGQPGMSGPAMTEMPGLAAQTSGFQAPQWSAPADWQAQPLGSMRKGSWTVSTGSGSAEISVLAFPGNVGGDLANINRWANQVGLGAMSPAQLDSERAAHTFTIASGEQGFYVHLDGPSGQSIAGAIITHGGASWFYKMMGDTATVQAQTPAFLEFVRSSRFPAQ
ncbi:hypothetical protein H5P28_03835 [Ruficoccus amylovorans]|uniref:Uncharacterized protein n=1 Tax=Ruficoccus amylovorans TaxID=1804625 RepID=A0A842HCW3_9BACT|nr:hypothetical protein [Ruficoccus amylovorans]MBC2593384.1 hypothetical protein [Ruficoccus amylovorans]